jgi:hypothetical protein
LPRIGREAFDIAALALGIDRVEGERRFPRTGQPGEDDQAVARNIEIDVFEVVFAGAADRDDAAILGGAPTGAAALRFGGFVEQVVHPACPLVAKFILKAIRVFRLPRRRDRQTRPPGLRE